MGVLLHSRDAFNVVNSHGTLSTVNLIQQSNSKRFNACDCCSDNTVEYFAPSAGAVEYTDCTSAEG